MRVEPVSSLKGEIRPPADKSISHRYAILGAMAQGTTHISNYSHSQDCHSTLDCLRKLGVQIHTSGNDVEVESPGWNRFQQPSESLDAGNSGTTIRLLSALLAASPFSSTIQGDESLNQRPMQRIMTPLKQMGARIEAQQGSPPLHIQGSGLEGIRYPLPVPSAQVKSCVLLAGLMATGQTTVIEEIPSRDHSERALPFFGTTLERKGTQLMVNGPASLTPAEMEIPGDFSAAAFFIMAALVVPDSDISLTRVGVNPSRTALLALLDQARAIIQRRELPRLNAEPVCNLKVRFDPATLQRFPSKIDGRWIPNLIDEIPALAVLGTCLEKGLTIKDAEELRKKESDRIHSVTCNLKNLGIQVEEFPDGFHIPPGQKIRGGQVQTFGDHRIAMAFAVAGLIAEKPVELDDPSCVSVSFPEFFQQLESIRA